MTVAMYWGISMQYGRHICSEADANNVKCMCSSASGHIVHCIKFTSGIYNDILVSWLHRADTAELVLRSPRTELLLVSRGILPRWL